MLEGRVSNDTGAMRKLRSPALAHLGPVPLLLFLLDRTCSGSEVTLPGCNTGSVLSDCDFGGGGGVI